MVKSHTMPVEQYKGQPSQLEAANEKFFKQGMKLAMTVEQELDVPLARFVHPQDLARVGLAVYADKEIVFRKFDTEIDTKNHIQDVVGEFTDKAFQTSGITREELMRKYPEFIGYGNYKEGEIGKALRTASEKLTPQETVSLKREFATL